LTNTKVHVVAGAGSSAGDPDPGGPAEIGEREARRLLGIVLGRAESAVTWRRAQIVLFAAQTMGAEQIAEAVVVDPGTVREVIENFGRDGFGSLAADYWCGRPKAFGSAERAEIRRLALSDPGDLGYQFAVWSISRLADHLVAEGLVGDISHEDLRVLLAGAGVELGRPNHSSGSTGGL
jgi:transposase